MSIYILSNNQNNVNRWKDIVVDAIVITARELSRLDSKDILILSENLYDLDLNVSAKVMLLGNEPSFEKCMNFLQKGVKAYGNTYMHASYILSAIDSLKDDTVWIYPDFVASMIGLLTTNNYDSLEEKISILTPREKEIAKLILDGLTNKEIAIELKISANTIKIHTTNIYKKLNVTDRLSLYSYLK